MFSNKASNRGWKPIISMEVRKNLKVKFFKADIDFN